MAEPTSQELSQEALSVTKSFLEANSPPCPGADAEAGYLLELLRPILYREKEAQARENTAATTPKEIATS